MFVSLLGKQEAERSEKKIRQGHKAKVTCRACQGVSSMRGMKADLDAVKDNILMWFDSPLKSVLCLFVVDCRISWNIVN